MDELEQIRMQRLQELRARQQQEEQMQQVLAQIDIIVKQLLTPEAQERLSNLFLVRPEIVQKLKVYLAQLYSAGKVKKINDEQLKDILRSIQGKKETKITRK